MLPFRRPMSHATNLMRIIPVGDEGDAGRPPLLCRRARADHLHALRLVRRATAPSGSSTCLRDPEGRRPQDAARPGRAARRLALPGLRAGQVARPVRLSPRLQPGRPPPADQPLPQLTAELKRPLADYRTAIPRRLHGRRRPDARPRDPRAGFLRRTRSERWFHPRTPSCAPMACPTAPTPTTRRCSRLMHAMRARIVTAPAFTGERIVAAILFVRTMDGEIAGVSAPAYLWRQRGVAPFVKIDQGLEAEADGVQLMKPVHGLDDTLARAVRLEVCGTKARSVIRLASPDGVEALVAQQFELAERVAAFGLLPIVGARGPDREPAEGAGRGPAARRPAPAPRRPAARPPGPPEAHPAGDRRPLSGPRRARRRRPPAGALGRLPPRRGLPARGPEPPHDRQLLPRPGRRPAPRHERCRVRRRPGPRRRPDLRRFHDR